MVKLDRTRHLLAIAISISCFSYFLSAYGDEKISTPELTAEQSHQAAEVHYNLGIESKQKDINAAIAKFREAIQLDPFYTEAHREYIDLMEKQGKKAEILEEYKVKVQQNPSSEMYHYLYGRVLDNIDDKLREFQKAVELNPDYYWGHYGLGNVYYEQDKLSQAITQYRKAIEIDPNHKYAHHNLGLVYENQGKLGRAITQYRKVIQIDPNHSSAPDDLERVRKLKDEKTQQLVKIILGIAMVVGLLAIFGFLLYREARRKSLQESHGAYTTLESPATIWSGVRSPFLSGCHSLASSG